jgi:hypothetical protein
MSCEYCATALQEAQAVITGAQAFAQWDEDARDQPLLPAAGAAGSLGENSASPEGRPHVQQNSRTVLL